MGREGMIGGRTRKGGAGLGGRTGWQAPLKGEKLLLIGNPALPRDGLALKLREPLARAGYEVEALDDPLRLFSLRLEEYILIDVAEGVREPTLLTGTSLFASLKPSSLHDLDAGYTLKLLEALGRTGLVRIIAVPRDGAPAPTAEKVLAILERLSSRIEACGSGRGRA